MSFSTSTQSSSSIVGGITDSFDKTETANIYVSPNVYE